MTDTDLLDQAMRARERAYAPYSGYRVGCAIWAGGKLYTGANVENVSFGACLCAERTAVSAAALDGVRTVDIVAIATQSSPPAAPCGICRQTLQEFAPDAARVRVIMGNVDGARIETTLAELFPRGFRRGDLDKVP